ncbi:RES domain-containing protein [Flavisphingomonas formosensis]|uniref:RES domain-containing protein n=1 Tax=Flavisphingomonas formosensis TaxID=861534 RepID=UPI0012F88278|nr:RES domain-containing protein [Sphingomonas formosensis]
MRFLWDFARDIAKPIKRNGREHIEYVPTQIVTEYLRRVFRDAGGQPIDGLIYRSSRHDGAKAFVLFCENDQCAESDYSGPIYKRLLQISGVQHRLCPPVPPEEAAT